MQRELKREVVILATVSRVGAREFLKQVQCFTMLPYLDRSKNGVKFEGQVARKFLLQS